MDMPDVRDNVAIRIAQQTTPSNELWNIWWNDRCMDLVAEVEKRLLEQGVPLRVLWIEFVEDESAWQAPRPGMCGGCEQRHEWRFHTVPIIDGLVHDAWHPELLLPVDEYLRAVLWEGSCLSASLFGATAEEDVENIPLVGLPSVRER